MNDRKKYQYWLRTVPKLTNNNRKRLIEYSGSAAEVYALSRRQLLNGCGLSEEQAAAVTASKKNRDLDQEMEKLEKSGISMISLEDTRFPRRLLELPDCPYALFYRGELPGDAEPTVAIVGARACSEYGKNMAQKLGEALAAYGVGIISGMASGIDSFGHWGALKGQGKTYAVLGCGADVCYPKGGRQLYEKICGSGGIISEYLPGTGPSPWQFPVRNRLISAFADAVIVVEAKKKSGSLITADFALEQGKDIYVLPGRVDDALSRGCNELIHQGAGIIVSVEDLLRDLGICQEKNKILSDGFEEKTKNLLEKEELLVYSCLDLHSKNMEELVQMTGLSVPVLADILVRLQAMGLIQEHFRNRYGKR